MSDEWKGYWAADFEYVNPASGIARQDTITLRWLHNPNDRPSIAECQYRIKEKWGWTDVRVLNIYYTR